MDAFSTLLHELGLERYTAIFVENDVDLEALRLLTDAELEKLGVYLGHRKKLVTIRAQRARWREGVQIAVIEGRRLHRQSMIGPWPWCGKRRLGSALRKVAVLDTVARLIEQIERSMGAAEAETENCPGRLLFDLPLLHLPAQRAYPVAFHHAGPRLAMQTPV